MTEQEWLDCTDPKPMLEHLKGNASNRKLRLFACACCRRVWQLLTAVDAKEDDPEAPSLREKVALAERYADDLVQRKQIEREYDNDSTYDAETLAAMWAVYTERQRKKSPSESLLSATNSSQLAAFAKARPKTSVYYIETPDAASSGRPRVFNAERKAQTVLIRDMFGNPFHPITVESSWLTSTVTALAQSIYDDRAFHQLPILADALEESGCADEVILRHCRQPGAHVRGCWVLDLVLGKE